MPEFLFTPVPHQSAIDFIRSKPVVSRDVFDQLLPELQARAFTITGMVPADVAQTVRDLIADVPAGLPWDKQKGLITRALSPYMDEADAIAKAELLLRVHGQEAYASAADAVMRRQVAVFPYWQYRTMGDSKVRPAHRALNGLILPANNAFWKTHDPPWEWGCRCIKIPMSDDDVNDIRARQSKNDLEGGWLLSDRLRQELELSNRLVRGANVHDVTPTGTFKFDPQTLTLSVDQLRARYSPNVWSQFEAWSRRTTISPNDTRTVWNWINGEPGPPEIASVANVRPAPTPLEATERRIMLNKTESAHIFTNEDTLLFSRKGTRTEVAFSGADVAQMKDTILTHNHPLGTAFSYADIQLAFSGDLTEIRAIGRAADGTDVLYRLRRPAAGWSSDELPHIVAAYKTVWRRLEAEARADVQAGRKTVEQVRTEHNHQVMLRLSELFPGVIIYERIEI
jgi:SPP1 gp7 family putative phage head morphogenesis protein